MFVHNGAWPRASGVAAIAAWWWCGSGTPVRESSVGVWTGKWWVPGVGRGWCLGWWWGRCLGWGRGWGEGGGGGGVGGLIQLKQNRDPERSEGFP